MGEGQERGRGRTGEGQGRDRGGTGEGQGKDRGGEDKDGRCREVWEGAGKLVQYLLVLFNLQPQLLFLQLVLLPE